MSGVGQSRAFVLGLDGVDGSDSERLISVLAGSAAVQAERAPYVGCFELVRQGFFRVLGDEHRSIESRLMDLMEVSCRLSVYYDENSVSVCPERLLSDLNARFHPSWSEPPAEAEIVARRVAHHYLNESALERSTRLGELVQRIRRDLYPGLDGERSREAEVAALSVYRSRRAFVISNHGVRVQSVLSNYCLHYLLIEQYTDWPSPRAYTEDLALSVASLRFLLFSHPGLAARGDVDFHRAAREVLGCLGCSVEHGRLLSELRRAVRMGEVPGAAGFFGLVTL